MREDDLPIRQPIFEHSEKTILPDFEAFGFRVVHNNKFRGIVHKEFLSGKTTTARL
jgi:hypothetical protein